jgi:hypothetical protein
MIPHINRIKDTNHIIISLDTETSDKIKNPFLTKTFNKLDIKGPMHQSGATANIKLSVEEVEGFPLRPETG